MFAFLQVQDNFGHQKYSQLAMLTLDSHPKLLANSKPTGAQVWQLVS